ncbi:hypothetical protein KP509_15G062300 [Ceratopteris richardii]|uniref:Syndetin n=2 Tax=Ceratopteris richardii TaxID=49495 RepID=A0A8T2T5V3_CERRI|nr:hypothetical protein KP509_15G062300 [Ceratopteris richardii]KAH7405248.1 hypothetical protein KP509_15G062300 [Ceratopteris richardii]
MLENLPSEDVDQKYFEAKVSERLLQLDANTEKLSKKVMEHHEEMVKGMQLVMELEKDLQVTNIICKNARRRLALAIDEVSQNLLISSNVKRKKILTDIIPFLIKMQHVSDIKSRLQGIVDEGNYAKALRMCSACMQLMDDCSGIAAIMDINTNIEEWLSGTLEKLDLVLLDVCQNFDADKYKMVIDAYTMIDDGGLGEKVQNCFVQIVVLETHTVLKNMLFEGEDQLIAQKKSRLPYNDLCVQLPESKFRTCLHKTLEVLFDLMCSYFSMMNWQPPPKEAKRYASPNELNRTHAHPADPQHLRTDKLHDVEVNNSCSIENVGNCKAEQTSDIYVKDRQGIEKAEIDICNVLQSGSDTILIEDSARSLFLSDDNDIAKVIDEVVEEGSLSGLTEKMRRDTVSNVNKTLDKGRKHVWELAARRVSALLSCDALCSTSPHHFLQSLDWVNRFVLAGEAFSGAEAVSLRAKLVKICEKYFGSFHRQSLEVLRMMLEKETWQQLSPAAIKTVNLAGLLGDGAPLLVASPISMQRGADSGLAQSVAEQGLVKSKDGSSGFSVWLERGNPFTDKRIQGLPLIGHQGSAVDGSTMSNGAVEQHPCHDEEPDDDENEDLLADFIDEDSQLPSRVYKSFKQSGSRDGLPHLVDEENLILTGSAVGILRYMDKYARLMQILQPITNEVFRGFSQLFELYFHYIFKIFGHRDAFCGSRAQAEVPSLMTARLRATSVRISQALEDQCSKNAIVSGSNQPMSAAANQSINFDLSQTNSSQGATNIFLSAVNLYGLKERYVAVESLICVAQMLRRSRPHLQHVLTKDALVLLDNFYSRTVDVAADLREHIYRTVAHLLLNIGGYIDRVGNIRWELKEIGTQHSGYVDLLLGEFKHYVNKLAHTDLPKEIREILLEYGVDNLAEVLLEGFSRAKRCTHDGRALMSLDLQVLINGLKHLAPQKLAGNLQVVETYIKAYYLPETEYLHWVRAHPEYSKAQVISLINVVAYGHKWTRKLRSEVLEKIESGDY